MLTLNFLSVFFAAWVTLEDINGIETTYRIVGPDEVDQQANYISIDSPLAKGLLKHYLDDEVNIETPGGKQTYWITAIRYTDQINA